MHSESSFLQMHETIQLVMGWENYHLYEFEFPRVTIGFPVDAFGEVMPNVKDAEDTKIKKHFRVEKQKCTYLYDFGDIWEHKIILEKIISSTSCPPEDVGGPEGYLEFLQVIADPKYEEYEHMMEWAGGDFDPARFNMDEVNANLRVNRSMLIPEIEKKKLSKKLTVSEVRSFLKGKSEKELTELIIKMFKESESAENCLLFEMSENGSEQLFNNIIFKISEQFFPEKGKAKMNVQVLMQDIADFEAITKDFSKTIYLKLIFAETMLDYLSSEANAEQFISLDVNLQVVMEDVTQYLNKKKYAHLFIPFKNELERIFIKLGMLEEDLMPIID